MKKLLFLLFCILCSLRYCNAQDIVNPGFVNTGNNTTNSCGSTFDATAITNWQRSHGSAQIINDGCEKIFLEYAHLNSQGIAGGYNFIAGKKYEISFDWCIWSLTGDNDFLDRHAIKFYATQYLPSGDLNNCTQDAAAITTAGTTEFIRTVTLADLTASPNPYSFSFVATQNSSYVWLFPEGLYTTTSGGVFIDNVFITDICDQDDLYLPNNTCVNATIIPGQYTVYRNIYVGSHFYGSFGTELNDPNGFTWLHASQQISLENDFLATASEGYLLADVGPINCTHYTDPGEKPGRPDDSRSESALLSAIQNNGSLISGTQQQGHLSNNLRTISPDGAIYQTEPSTNERRTVTGNAKHSMRLNPSNDFVVAPNPTSDCTEITPLGAVNYPVHISLKDVTGRTITNSQFESSKMKIDLSSYSPGLYLIDVRTNEGVKTYRVTKK